GGPSRHLSGAVTVLTLRLHPFPTRRSSDLQHVPVDALARIRAGREAEARHVAAHNADGRQVRGRLADAALPDDEARFVVRHVRPIESEKAKTPVTCDELGRTSASRTGAVTV